MSFMNQEAGKGPRPIYTLGLYTHKQILRHQNNGEHHLREQMNCTCISVPKNEGWGHWHGSNAADNMNPKWKEDAYQESSVSLSTQTRRVTEK